MLAFAQGLLLCLWSLGATSWLSFQTGCLVERKEKIKSTFSWYVIDISRLYHLHNQFKEEEEENAYHLHKLKQKVFSGKRVIDTRQARGNRIREWIYNREKANGTQEITKQKIIKNLINLKASTHPDVRM